VNKIATIMVISLSLFFLFTSELLAKTDGFPGRSNFPDVPVIESQELFGLLNDVIIVDARSKYEYQTLRIKGALNIPVVSKHFVEDLRKLAITTKKPIVFYCNGRTCYKSYQAVAKGNKAGINNIIAYDAGVFEWTKSYPKMAVLMGTSPVDLNKLITKKKLTSHFLSAADFDKKIGNSKNSIVLDIRDTHQRAGTGFYPGREQWVSLSNQAKLTEILAIAKRKNTTLFIYDEVGKQVRWFQYALEKEGIKNYYFMEKGANGYYAMLISTM